MLPLAIAASLPGWIEIGPERGHVMDVAVTGVDVLALTRVGVLRAGLDLAKWERDPRFPMQTRHLAAGPDGAVWAVTLTGVWRVTDTPERVAALPANSLAVDLVATGDAAFVAVRGQGQGVWRVRAGEEPERVLEADAWALTAEGEHVWAGTLDAGLWSAADGRRFTREAEGVVSAVARIAGETWVGWADGRITHGGSTCSVEGPPIAIAPAGGRVLAVVDGAAGARPALSACDGEPVGIPPPDDDPSVVQPTGIWALDEERAILGDFRRGPSVVDAAGVRAARTGFRATQPADALLAPDGRLAVILMAVGTYAFDGTDWRSLGEAATDVVDLALDGDALLVVDFDGLLRGDERSAGVAVPGAGRSNGLVQVARDGEGRLWGRDFGGGLWLEREGWRACSSRDVSRLEGEPLLLATRRGWFTTGDCATEGERMFAAIRTDPTSSRSDGRVVAAPGGLWRDGVRVATLPSAGVTALASRGAEVLVASADGGVRLCMDSCVPVAVSLPNPLRAVGWLADGRVWAAEEEGTVLLVGGNAAVRPTHARSADAADARPAGSFGGPTGLVALGVPPWRSVGLPRDPHRAESGLDLRFIAAELVVIVLGAAWVLRGRRWRR